MPTTNDTVCTGCVCCVCGGGVIPNLTEVGNALWIISIGAVVCYAVSRLL